LPGKNIRPALHSVCGRCSEAGLERALRGFFISGAAASTDATSACARKTTQRRHKKRCRKRHLFHSDQASMEA
jgi:hypothetical protein